MRRAQSGFKKYESIFNLFSHPSVFCYPWDGRHIFFALEKLKGSGFIKFVINHNESEIIYILKHLIYTLVGNEIVGHSDVGAAPTTFSINARLQ